MWSLGSLATLGAGTRGKSRYCERDYSPYCDDTGSCSIPAFNEDCGLCANTPTRAACE